MRLRKHSNALNCMKRDEKTAYLAAKAGGMVSEIWFAETKRLPVRRRQCRVVGSR